MNTFVMKERLHWTPISSTGDPPEFTHHSAVPFEDRRDYAVLLNDWPYGYDKGIAHLVVWSRTPIAVDDEQGGDVTLESQRLIEDFVKRHFVEEIGQDGEEKVQWFKNWTSLQSVRGVDHVHILLRDVPEDLQKKWMERQDLSTS